MASKHPLDDLWPVLDPPAGFGDRVLEALERATPTEPLHAPDGAPVKAPRPGALRAIWLAAGICAGAAAAATILSFRPQGSGQPGDPPSSGHLIADIRQTLPIGDRALAVAERGAELAWFVVAGIPRVEQARGSVFYRVDRGGPFTVATPVGDVRVTGTCFRVSVETPGDERLGTVALVEVLEGSVLLADRRGQLALAAGEKGRMSLRSPPGRIEDEAAAVSPLDPEMQERVRRLEEALVEARKGVAAGGPPDDSPPRDKFFDLTPDDLRALARQCEMRYYLPRHVTSLDAPKVDTSFGLAADQQEAVLRLMQEHRDQYIAALQALYIEVTGDRAIALRLAPKSLQEDLFAKLDPHDLKEARRRMLDEWAQGRSSPTGAPRSAAERFMRLHSGAGETFFRKLVDLVGPERARHIREQTTSDALRFAPAYDCSAQAGRSPR
jgi:hypothetical protein